MECELKTGYATIDAVLSAVGAGELPIATAPDFFLLQAVKTDLLWVGMDLRKLACEGLPAARVVDAVSRFRRAVWDASDYVAGGVLRAGVALRETRKGGDDGNG